MEILSRCVLQESRKESGAYGHIVAQFLIYAALFHKNALIFHSRARTGLAFCFLSAFRSILSGVLVPVRQ
jgi:hypothetical protein